MQIYGFVFVAGLQHCYPAPHLPACCHLFTLQTLLSAYLFTSLTKNFFSHLLFS